MAIAIHPLDSYISPPDHRVYARRRLIAGLLVIAAAVLASLVAVKIAAVLPDVPASVESHVPSAAGQSGDAPIDPAAGLYVVQPGDSMWEIALRLAPGQSTTDVVDQLVHLNGGADLAIGQRLVLPRP